MKSLIDGPYWLTKLLQNFKLTPTFKDNIFFIFLLQKTYTSLGSELNHHHKVLVLLWPDKAFISFTKQQQRCGFEAFEQHHSNYLLPGSLQVAFLLPAIPKIGRLGSILHVTSINGLWSGLTVLGLIREVSTDYLICPFSWILNTLKITSDNKQLAIVIKGIRRPIVQVGHRWRYIFIETVGALVA